MQRSGQPDINVATAAFVARVHRGKSIPFGSDIPRLRQRNLKVATARPAPGVELERLSVGDHRPSLQFGIQMRYVPSQHTYPSHVSPPAIRTLILPLPKTATCWSDS